MMGERSRELVVRGKSLRTPFFMPDATRASIRGVMSGQLNTCGTEAIVVNTYHLMLQPGSKLIAQSGGIHRFMRWDGLVLSDSGGYQVYSLIHKNPEMGRITEEGAEFRSVLDGSKHLLTPEKAIQIQFDLGVDMMVVLDDPRPNSASEEEIDQAVDRSIRWAERCRIEYDRQIKDRGLTNDSRPFLFGVVQGGKSRELRKKCVEGLSPLGFDGYGFGARHIDESGEFLADIVEYTASILPEDKIRFALGVGTPQDIVRFWQYGWDMFDCVIPTREGRHGRLFLSTINDEEKKTKSDSSYDTLNVPRSTTLNITNGRYKNDFSVIEEGCGCPTCLAGYTRAYIHHLFRVGEVLGGQLAMMHNLFFYNEFMKHLRGKNGINE